MNDAAANFPPSADAVDGGDEARVEMSGAVQREAFLSRAAQVLAASSDYQGTLESVAQLAVPVLGDWCFVDLAEGETYRRVALAHADAGQHQLAQLFRRSFPLRPDVEFGVSRVLENGQAQLHANVDGKMLEQAACDDEHRALLHALNVHSALSVALSTRGRILGALTMVCAQNPRVYSVADLQLASDMAHIAALAIDNARLHDEAEAANRAKDEFLAVLSHELRTPLTPILGWVYLLRQEPPEPAVYQRALEIIEQNARVQERLIEDLIDVSRIVTGKLRLEKRALELAPLLAQTIETARPQGFAKHLQWRVEAGSQNSRVMGDEMRLRQALGHLLSNAIKFTPENGHIEVRLSCEGARVCIEVKDSGQGIEAAFLPRLFQQFQQADSSAVRRSGGLGLGLTLVRHIAQLHGGTVRAWSEGANRGAVFRLELPLLPPSAPVVFGAVANEPVSLEGARVLVVDDEEAARELIETLLSRGGAQVKCAANSEEAWQLFQSWRPDVLVSDLKMPGEDGFSLMQRVRQLPSSQGGQLPAMALTAHLHPNDLARALSCGFNLHIAKPTDPAALASAMLELLAMVRE